MLDDIQDRGNGTLRVRIDHLHCTFGKKQKMQKSALLRSIDEVVDSRSVTSGLPEPTSNNVLLLQGPIGPFFSRFATDLTSRGFNVTKVNFNGGDSFFNRSTPALDFTGTVASWEGWIESKLVSLDISRIYLFGDCRAYHRIASKVARQLNIRVFVFEEGYLRPNFITLEEDGVNGHSTMLSNPFMSTPVDAELPVEQQHPGHIFQITAIYSMLYYMASAARRKKFRGYRHHRPFGCLTEGARWIRSGIRKLKYAHLEKDTLSELISQYDGNYFFCPLQVHCDMQVIEHSDFHSIEHFIGDVLKSFSEHASSDKAIVFKHHPLDRGYTDYTTLFSSIVTNLGLEGRVFYVHDACLPTLLKHAQGTVLINSTVGISSLFHGTPVKTLGKSVYNVDGLTAQQSLDEFWSCERVVDSKKFSNFRSQLINRNQLNGNLYRRISKEGATGIIWSESIATAHTWHGAVPETGTTGQLQGVQGKSKNDPDYGNNDVTKAA